MTRNLRKLAIALAAIWVLDQLLFGAIYAETRIPIEAPDVSCGVYVPPIECEPDDPDIH